MSDLRGRRIVFIMRAVIVSYRRVDEFINIDPIQAIDPNGIKFPAQFGTFSPPERTDSALSSKHVVNVVGLVINEVRFTCEEAEEIRSNDSAPQSRHPAH
jgi:hypothetical protein